VCKIGIENPGLIMTEKKVRIRPRGDKPGESRVVSESVAVSEAKGSPDQENNEALASKPLCGVCGEPTVPPETLSDQQRFQFFLIDSGWNTVCANVIRDNLDMVTRFQNDDPLYILTKEQSIDILKRHPHLIGKDPVLLARDLRAGKCRCSAHYRGFHLNLGILWEPNKAADSLRTFLNFLSIHRQSANIEDDIKKRLHHEGLKEVIEVLRLSGETMVA
jgi:hypothetical protein